MLVFFLPRVAPSQAQPLDVLVVVAMAMFLPVVNLLRALPEYEHASVAAEHLLSLEQRLEQTQSATVPVPLDPWGGRFCELRLTDLRLAGRGNSSSSHADDPPRLLIDTRHRPA